MVKVLLTVRIESYIIGEIRLSAEKRKITISDVVRERLDRKNLYEVKNV